MNQFIARKALSKKVIKGYAEDRFSDLEPKIVKNDAAYCLVFQPEDNSFLGIIRLQDIIFSSPHRILADLIEFPTHFEVHAGDSLTQTLAVMQEHKTDFVLVRSSAKKYLGLVTRESILQTFRAAYEQVEQSIAEETDILSLLNLQKLVDDRTRDLTDLRTSLQEFSSHISHDLRAPLRTIRGFSEILLEDYGSHLPADGHEFAKKIGDAATEMDRLIQEIVQNCRARTAVASAKSPL